MRTGAVLVLAVLLSVLACGVVMAQAQGQPARTINLELRDADIQDALSLLFRGSDRSYTLEPGVSAKVTLTLKDVTWDQALRLMMRAVNLEYELQDSTYRIYRKPAVTRAPVIDQAPVEQMQRPGEQRTTVGQPTATRAKVHLVQVRNADASELAALFGGLAVGAGWGGMPLGPSAYGIGGTTAVGGGGLLGYGGYGEYGGVYGYGGLGYGGGSYAGPTGAGYPYSGGYSGGYGGSPSGGLGGYGSGYPGGYAGGLYGGYPGGLGGGLSGGYGRSGYGGLGGSGYPGGYGRVR